MAHAKNPSNPLFTRRRACKLAKKTSKIKNTYLNNIKYINLAKYLQPLLSSNIKPETYSNSNSQSTINLFLSANYLYNNK